MGEIESALAALRPGDLFLSVGTSGVVYPAAGFAAEAGHRGARLVEANLAGTETSPLFDELLQGPATETVPALVEKLIAQMQ